MTEQRWEPVEREIIVIPEQKLEYGCEIEVYGNFLEIRDDGGSAVTVWLPDDCALCKLVEVEGTQGTLPLAIKQDIADVLDSLIAIGIIDPDESDTVVSRIGGWISQQPGAIESRLPHWLQIKRVEVAATQPALQMPVGALNRVYEFALQNSSNRVEVENVYDACTLVGQWLHTQPWNQATQPAITPDWSRAPKWANWWAVRDNPTWGGEQAWYENKPDLRHGIWWPVGKWTYEWGVKIPPGYDWRNSLQQRPGTEQPAAEVVWQYEGLAERVNTRRGMTRLVYISGQGVGDLMEQAIDALDYECKGGDKVRITVERVQP